MLPYLTLVPPRDWDGSLLSSLRQGDVVYLRSDERDHLAVVTTIVKDTGHNASCGWPGGCLSTSVRPGPSKRNLDI